MMEALARPITALAQELSALISAGAGLGGVLVGAWLAGRQERRGRRAAFLTRQLEELYGPLLSHRQEIQTRSTLRVQISNAADRVWREQVENAGLDTARRDEVLGRFDEFRRIIDDENTIFRDELLPAYRAMIAVSREKFWLAEPETRVHFPELISFVDVWERYLRESIPPEVISALNHSEANLQQFYTHLEEAHDRLRAELASLGGRQ